MKTRTLTQDELNLIISKLQHKFRTRRAFRNVEKSTGINIEHQSQINMLDLYARLRNGADLPDNIKKSIESEKIRPNDVLTPKEKIWFLTALLEVPIIANHASPESEKIRSSGYIFSSDELERRNINVRSHTSNDYGERGFVFLSYTLPLRIDAVNFLAQADLFLIDLDQYARNFPHLYKSMWTGPHFYAYDTGQNNAPIELTWRNNSTRTYMRYEITFTPGVKYKRTTSYQYNDITISQSFSREQEISAGRHIKPFHLLRMLELIRFMDPTIRAMILDNPQDRKLMADLFYIMFTPGKAELHFPAVFQIKNDPTIFQFQPWNNAKKDYYWELLECIENGNHAKLQLFLQKELQLSFYRYRENDLSLLNLAVLKRDHTSVRLLMQAGINADHIYTNPKQHVFLQIAQRTALLDAVELNDFAMVKLLCESVKTSSYQINTFVCSSVKTIDMFTAIADKVSNETFDYLLTFYKSSHENIDELLLAAVLYDNHHALRSLLKAGADPNTTHSILMTDTNAHIIPLSLEGTALTVAAKHGRSKCVKILLRHGALPNTYIETPGIYERYGRGDSALIRAVDGIHSNHNMHESSMGRIDRCRYSKLTKSAMKYYYQVIRDLLDAGADPYYIAGDGANFVVKLSGYLSTNKDEILQKVYDKLNTVSWRKPPVRKPGAQYSHKTYALVTANGPDNEKMLLIAETDKTYIISWWLPGGTTNYIVDQDMAETAVNLTAYQTGLDLILYQKSKRTIRYATAGDKRVFELQHFELDAQVDKLQYQSNTFDCRQYYIKRDHQLVDKLFNIQFIPLREITVTPVMYKGVLFPVCSWKNTPLPYFASLKIAELCGHHHYESQELHKLLVKLFFRRINFITEEINAGNLPELKSVFALGMHQFGFRYDYDNLDKSLKQGYYDIVEYLLSQDYRFDQQQFNFYFDEYKCKIKHPEEVVVMLLKAHKNLLQEYGLSYLAQYAACYDYQNVIDELNSINPKALSISAIAAAKYGNLPALKKILAKVAPDERNNNIAELLQHNVHLHDREKDRVKALDITEYLLPYYTSHTQSKWFLRDLCQELEGIIKNNEGHALQHRVLAIIKLVIEKKLYRAGDVEIYGFYMRWCYESVRSEKKSGINAITNQILNEFLQIIITIPSIAIHHADSNKDILKVQQLLEQHYNDPFVRQWLFESNWSIDHKLKDQNGDNLLQKSVKSGAINVVKLLLETCSHKEDFNLNFPDVDERTTIINAIKCGYTAIAKLLIIYGAKFDENTVKFARQHNNRELVDFMQNRLSPIETQSAGPSAQNEGIIVISTEAPQKMDNSAKSGDVDYANNLSRSLQKMQPGMKVYYFNHDTCAKTDELLKQNRNLTFHLMINAPRTGFAVSIDYLEKLKKQNVKVIITAIEFAKHKEPLQAATLEYLQHADQIIFLDENDKNTAVDLDSRSGNENQKNLQAASVISVPPTISPEHISTNKTSSNIMCFGMLRKGKGFGHILHLAKLIKSSDDKLVNNKQIYIVGTVQLQKTKRGNTAYDPTLYTILKEMYPQHANKFLDQSIEELIKLYEQLKDTDASALPIKLFLNVDESKLTALFKECEYSFYPAYRGVTLRNSSISTSLAYGNIIYSHISDITPQSLRSNGEYHNAMVLFNSDKYATYAVNVFNDMKARELDRSEMYTWSKRKSRNEMTRDLAKDLLANELALDKVTQRHMRVYSSQQPVVVSLVGYAHSGTFKTPVNKGDDGAKVLTPRAGV